MADVTVGVRIEDWLFVWICGLLFVHCVASLFQNRKLPIILLCSDLHVGFAPWHAHPECLLRAKSFCPLKYFFIQKSYALRTKATRWWEGRENCQSRGKDPPFSNFSEQEISAVMPIFHVLCDAPGTWDGWKLAGGWWCRRQLLTRQALSSGNVTRPTYVPLPFLDANVKTEKGRKVKIIFMDDTFYLRSQTSILLLLF